MDKTAKERMRRMRERNKDSVTLHGAIVTSDVTQLPVVVTLPVTYDDELWLPPSKFLSREVQLQVQKNVEEALSLMSGKRRAEFRTLSNSFIPNMTKNLVKPEV